MSEPITSRIEETNGAESSSSSVPSNGRGKAKKTAPVRRTFNVLYDESSAPTTTSVKLSTGHKFKLAGDVTTNDPAELIELAARQTTKETAVKVGVEYADTSKATRNKALAPMVLSEMLEEHFLAILG